VYFTCVCVCVCVCVCPSRYRLAVSKYAVVVGYRHCRTGRGIRTRDLYKPSKPHINNNYTRGRSQWVKHRLWCRARSLNISNRYIICNILCIKTWCARTLYMDTRRFFFYTSFTRSNKILSKIIIIVFRGLPPEFRIETSAA
jgi:hypothetical protein